MDIEILKTYECIYSVSIYYMMDDGIYGICVSDEEWEDFWKGDKEVNDDTAYIFLTLENFENAKSGNGPFETLEEAEENV